MKATVSTGRTVPSVAIVNASNRADGITKSIEPYFEGLSHLGYDVKWFQCVDFRGDPRVPTGGVTVPGLGFPSRTLDMGFNRLWVFPHRLSRLSADTVLLADPTLVRVLPSNGRVVVYVHDLRPLSEYADRISTRLMFRNVLPRLKRVWRVVVPSTFVRGQLLSLGFAPEQVHLIPETHDLGYHPEHVERSVRRVAERKETRVLFVGTDRPYKNIELVLELARRMRDRPGHRYTFTLLSRLRRETRRSIRKYGLSEVRELSEVDSVAQVYDAHDVLVFPSLYEGFGRPLIEAMAFGLPILGSQIDPVAEVVGEGGILLDPRRPEAWAAALSSLEDPAVLSSFARKSLDRGTSYLPARFEGFLIEALGAS